MPTLRNVSGVPLLVGDRTVDTSEVIQVPGKFAKDQPADAYLIGTGDDARAWPHAHWNDETAHNKEND